jgi:hypothetical protein
MKTWIIGIYLLMISVLSHAQSTDDPSNRKLIIGRWVSTADKKYEVVFTKTQKIEYYDKESNDTARYWIRNDSLIVKGNDPGDSFCYSIENLSDKYLSLMALGNHGNMLLFRRAKIKAK